jgi:5-methylcytosine-specific restriction endonuclease McrA
VALPRLICVPPDLLILNGRMPGLHGIDFFLNFRQFSKAPVVFLSASADEIAARLQAVGKPAAAYVDKPFSQRRLVEVVAATLAEHDPSVALREERRRKKERRRKRFELLRTQFFGTCFYCERPLLVPGEGPRKCRRMTTRDHLIPRSQGGKRNTDNIVAACYGCNNRRGDLPWLVFFAMVRKEMAEKEQAD